MSDTMPNSKSTEQKRDVTRSTTLTTEQRNREKRRASNRKSEQKSRYRENVMREELQRRAHNLAKRNSQIIEENNTLRQALLVLKQFGSMEPAGSFSQNNVAMQSHSPLIPEISEPCFSNPVKTDKATNVLQQSNAPVSYLPTNPLPVMDATAPYAQSNQFNSLASSSNEQKQKQFLSNGSNECSLVEAQNIFQQLLVLLGLNQSGKHEVSQKAR